MHKITTTLRILKATPSRNRVLKIESACGCFENQRQNGLGLHERASVTTASPAKSIHGAELVVKLVRIGLYAAATHDNWEMLQCLVA